MHISHFKWRLYSDVYLFDMKFAENINPLSAGAAF